MHNEPDELVQLRNFGWVVPPDGYSWMRANRISDGTQPPVAKTTDLFLVERPSKAEPLAGPLDDTLFREFAETPQTREGALSFANKYGWLGVAEPITPAVSQDETHRVLKIPIKLGERKRIWLTEIAAMYRLVRLWDPTFHSRSGTPERFEQRIAWIPDEQILYEWVTDSDQGREIVASKMVRPWLLDRLKPATDLHRTRRCYLQGVVNGKLTEHGVKVRLLWDRKFERLGLTMVPTNLIGFLWLQFAKAIEGGTAYRRCEDCGKWFALGGKSGRADKRFCSGTCKARTHRCNKKKVGS